MGQVNSEIRELGKAIERKKQVIAHADIIMMQAAAVMNSPALNIIGYFENVSAPSAKEPLKLEKIDTIKTIIALEGKLLKIEGSDLEIVK